MRLAHTIINEAYGILYPSMENNFVALDAEGAGKGDFAMVQLASCTIVVVELQVTAQLIPNFSDNCACFKVDLPAGPI